MASSPPNFERSISLNDLDSSLRVRELIKGDIISPEDERRHCHLKNSSDFTFVLRSFKDLALDFKKFLYSYLLDVGIYKELEENKKLNWCPSLFPMVPVLTLGDGNCLMHAASIGMWAVNDRYHTLRKLVYDAILEDTEGIFHKRWQREHEKTNLRVHGYSMTEQQWDREWEIVMQLVSQEEYPIGHEGMQYGNLEEIHIFVLANVLRRTIIVVSSDILRGNYDESLSPVNFPGIYLPLNWDPVDCVKTPLVIGFAQGHFTAIVSFEDGIFDQGEAMDGPVDRISEKIHGVPLQKHDGSPLPIHFLFANEEELADGLLRQYLDCKKLTYKDPEDGSLAVTLAAKIDFIPPPEPIKTLVEGFFARARETYRHMVQTKELQAGDTPSLALQPCRTEGCEFFGTPETLFMCSKCLEKHLKNEENQVGLLAHNMEAALREEHPPWRTTDANTGIKKEAFPSPFGIATIVREEIPQRTTELQPQAMGLTLQQQQQLMDQQEHQTIGVIHQQQKREFELIEQERQQKQREKEQQQQQQVFEILQQQQRQQQQQQQQQQREYELKEQQQKQIRQQQQQQQEKELLQQQQRQQQQQREYNMREQQQQRQQQQQVKELHLLHQLQQQQQQQQREYELQEQQQQQQQQQQMVQHEQQPKKCITHGCKYKANVGTGNLCYRCHEAEKEAEQQTASMVSMNIQAKPCANSVNGCQYYGLPHQEDLCSRCYRKFCLEMESLAEERNVEVPSRSELAVSPPPAANACQTPGCPNPGCLELYGRCVECYSRCIKDFIFSYDGLPLGGAAHLPPSPPQPPESQPSASSRPLTSPQPSPQAPLPQTSPLPPSHLGQTSSRQSSHCIQPGCQNKGVPSHGGQCTECHNIKPINAERLVTPTTKTKEMNATSSTTPVAHAQIITAGLPCGEPAIEEENKRLFCKTPKCNNPVRECSLCTKCVMARCHQGTTSLPQHSTPLPPGGTRTTEPQLSRENLEAGLGAAGFGVEKVGLNQLQSNAAEERRKATALARQKLPPLQMPPSSAKPGSSAPQPGNPTSTNTPGANIQCVAPNCTFYGNAEHNYYCSRCFKNNREEWQKISDLAQATRSRHDDHLVHEPLSRDPRVVSQKSHKIRKCALTYCYNLETPGNNGLCDKCYRTALTTEKEWQSSNRALNESQRQPPIHVPITTATPSAPPAPAATTRPARPLKKGFIDAGAPCKTPGCLKFGTLAKQGLCDPCYEKLLKIQPLATSTSASGSSSATVIVCVAQQRTSQPTNWSNVTKGPYILAPGVTTTFSAQDPITVAQQSTGHFGARLSNRCKEESCNMTGSAEYGGYCSQCFAVYTRQSPYPESVPDFKDSPKVQAPTLSAVSTLSNLNLTSTLTTSTSTVTGGLTALEPRVCAMEECENFVSPCTVTHCRDCLAKYHAKLSKKP